ncbi:NAD(P)-dependent oxidoreductase [Paenibacillus darwinianus]|uniref:NAD(P)-dependent oxidoreductase n=1 Tax=Paenibacillus darwinianus TaxID=1380763 RepID=A0A9W5S3Q1_9BACL|nr:SAF domain-containing protein [Paenibacillus darwinianus]EXX86918.1 NAD(P)-dependent oxidoreductase [Paenibacillus darwinianus]EXX90663.1 NAD(P)-dependent oxidoreductase [Paenibacillus darwinianus]EXX91623.1 NAD(P)-dependent oxidoreductase [Paenibacillus darwinianus]
MNFNKRLLELARQGGCIRVGLIGAGQMGRGMVSQIEGMNGMRVVATADVRPQNAMNAYLHAGIPAGQIVETGDLEKADRAIAQGNVVVTGDMHMLLALQQVDVVVDATGVPSVGAEIAWKAILAKKHVVMLNVETDVTVGPLLNRMASAAGIVYTGAAGDEPGAVMELYQFAETLGFEVLAIGKGKNNPLNLQATPDSAREAALSVGANPKMIASFQDGTKTMIEMTAVANATGFVPDVAGMHGPEATVSQLTDVLRLKTEGGILDKYGIVEYVNGVAPGVFVIVTSEKEEVRREMTYLKMGKGPNYVLFRPYHLTSLETPLSVANAYFFGEQTIAPWKGLVAETVAVAKKDLNPGDRLDGLGGFTVYGRIMTAADSKAANGLPIGLVQSQVMTRSVKAGEILTLDSIEQTQESVIWKLRQLMEQTIPLPGSHASAPVASIPQTTF